MAHLANLNDAQSAAVLSESKVLQVLAPPGSGKTKTLTSRVAHLLGDLNFLPWNVICLTFTNKSALEMKERVGKLIGEEIGNKVILGTFHSICKRYLQVYGHLIGMQKNFGIADSSTTKGIVTRVIKRGNLNLEVKFVTGKISKCKAKNTGWEQLLASTTGSKPGVDQHEFIAAYRQYEEQLQIANLLDYDDLLLRCAELLRTQSGCINNVQAVLIDEFQDTNTIQFELMTLFAQRCEHVTTVGDPDQSIYGWRSAEVANLGKMRERWPETVVINLEQNYRSAGAILEAAQSLIEQDTNRPEKALRPVHCSGTRPVFRKLYTARNEADWITTEIKRATILSAGLLDHADFAVLVRSAALSRPIEAAFNTEGIPYRMVGGLKFFDRVEIKLLLDYLRVIALPSNNDALARIINVPSRKIGKETIKSLLEEAIVKKCTMWQVVIKAVQRSKTTTKLTAPQLVNLSALYDLVETCRSMLDTDDKTTPRTLLEYLAKKLKLSTYLEKEYKQDHEIRWENVDELFAQADDPALFSDSSEDPEALPQVEGIEQEVASGPGEALTRFLANVTLQSDKQIENDLDSEGNARPQVTISTIHAAKGLEWPVVFIPACYQGSIPHSRTENVDEERRLLYVAMTRAKAMLNLSCPSRSSTNEDTTLSVFLEDSTVKKGLDEKGHMYEYSVFEGIASILGRNCPPRERLAAAVRDGGLENVTDDENQWPLDGSQSQADVEILWSGQQDVFGGLRPSKRRKISDQEEAMQIRKQVVSTLYAKTTMGGAEHFTVPSQPMGFVSAAQEMQIQHDVDAMRGPVPEKSAEQDAHESGTKVGKTSKPKGTTREAGQASLSSWFVGAKTKSALSASASASQPTALKPVPMPVNQSVARQSSSRAFSGFSVPTLPVPNRAPMAPAPAAAVNKNLRLMSSLSSLRKPTIDHAATDKISNQRFVLLSSSPPPEDGPDSQLRSAQTMPTDSNGTAASLVRTATTTHNTTLSRLGTTGTSAPRRLGMRGPMVGWSVKSRTGMSGGPSGQK